MDILDKQNEKCDYFADLMRSPARSIKALKQINYHNRINAIKIQNIEKERRMTCAQLDHDIYIFTKKIKKL